MAEGFELIGRMCRNFGWCDIALTSVLLETVPPYVLVNLFCRETSTSTLVLD
jgi:hypothetical protein